MEYHLDVHVKYHLKVADNNKSSRKIINFPLENGTVYAFGNKINTYFTHGIPPILNCNDLNSDKGRISIIICGISQLII